MEGSWLAVDIESETFERLGRGGVSKRVLLGVPFGEVLRRVHDKWRKRDGRGCSGSDDGLLGGRAEGELGERGMFHRCSLGHVLSGHSFLLGLMRGVRLGWHLSSGRCRSGGENVVLRVECIRVGMEP